MGKIKFDIAGWKEKLLNGADINKPDESGLTALEQAILDDNISAVEFCIKQGADVNLNNKPMSLAADYSKNPKLIDLLVSLINLKVMHITLYLTHYPHLHHYITVQNKY